MDGCIHFTHINDLKEGSLLLCTLAIVINGLSPQIKLRDLFSLLLLPDTMYELQLNTYTTYIDWLKE